MSSKILPKHQQYLLVAMVILGFALVRLWIAPSFDLSVDEAHYVLYGMRLDWSYFDHPPLVGWIQGLFLWTLGAGELQARLPAILLSILTAVLCWKFLQPYLRNTSAGLWALVGLNVSFGVTALSLMLLPDSILFPITFLFIAAAEQVRVRGTLKDWLLLGLITGLAGLSKYSAILLPVALLIAVLESGEWRHFLAPRKLPKLGLAIITALLIITPVLYWNLMHGFASFQYQQGHALRTSDLHLLHLFTSYATQLLAFGPFVAPIAWYGLWRLSQRKEFVSRLSLWICLVFFGVLSFSGLGKPTLPHWWGVLYILAIPIGIVLLLQVDSKKWRRLTQAAIVLNLVFVIAIQVELAYPFLPMPAKLSLHRDFRGWPSIMNKAQILLAAAHNPTAMIAVPNWSLGSRAMYYTRDPNKVLVVDNRSDQFDLWQPLQPQGRDLLFILPQHFHIDVATRYNCASVEQSADLSIDLPTHRVNQIAFVWCRNFGGLRL